jgi:hypothetical protein
MWETNNRYALQVLEHFVPIRSLNPAAVLLVAVADGAKDTKSTSCVLEAEGGISRNSR